MTKAETLIADRVRYFAPGDEAAFFGWLDRMGVVAEYEGLGDGLHIRLSRQPTDDELRELIAFHKRYGIDMRQLARFETAENADWFAAPTMYWHDGVYGSGHLPTEEISAKLRMVETILHWVWDPIGVRGIPEALDEYDMYAPAVLELLQRGASDRDVASYLTSVVRDRMELRASPEKDADVAVTLRALYLING